MDLPELVRNGWPNSLQRSKELSLIICIVSYVSSVHETEAHGAWDRIHFR